MAAWNSLHLVAEGSMSGGVDDSGGASGPNAAGRVAALTWRAAAALADVVMPPVCVACQAPLALHDALCPTCWGQIDFIGAPLCDRLGIPMPFDTGGAMVSAAAVANPPDYDRARAVAEFRGTLQKLIHRFKYSDRHDGRVLFGRWMASAGAALLADCDVIVPIPLNRWRLLGRRYNQSAILANEVSRLTSVVVAPMALARVRPTVRQVGLSIGERQANVAGAFQVPKSARAVVEGRRVLLMDDVITTGATCNSAARALKAAGARQVDVLALAVVSHTVS